jgi:hypothetical protein
VMVSREIIWLCCAICWRKLLKFDNGEEKELPSSVLKVENMIAALTPDDLLPVPHGVQEERILEKVILEQLLDENEEEDLPNQLPDLDEVEVELVLQFAKEEIPITTNEAEANPNERIPGMDNPTSNEAIPHPVEKEANNNTTNEVDGHERMLGQLPTVADVTENDNATAEIRQQLSNWQRKAL